MTEKRKIGYDDLMERGNKAFYEIRKILIENDLLIAVKKNENGKQEIIFSDKEEYIKHNIKKAVSIEMGMFNATCFESIEDVPEHLMCNAEFLK